MRYDGQVITSKMLSYIREEKEIIEREREELKRLLILKEREIKYLREYIRELEKVIDYYKSLCVIDELTNVYNRRYIIEVLKKEKAFADRTGEKFSIALIDVDNFKEVNDRYGHEVGDKVLEMVAFELQNSVREADIVGRWGGDEFVVILRNTDISRARNVALRILENVRKIRVNSLNLSVSLGLVQYGGESLKDLIRKVDAALYRAKSKGKDRVCIVSN